MNIYYILLLLIITLIKIRISLFLSNYNHGIYIYSVSHKKSLCFLIKDLKSMGYIIHYWALRAWYAWFQASLSFVVPIVTRKDTP